jgi:hypothetical protein
LKDNPAYNLKRQGEEKDGMKANYLYYYYNYYCYYYFNCEWEWYCSKIQYTVFMLVSCLAYNRTLKVERASSPKSRFNFNELHGVISQKIELFNRQLKEKLTEHT